MPSINFKPEFAEPVKNGTKRQTIRQIRKNPIKPGDMLTMFTGQRTKECRKLCMHKCKSVEEIEITIEKFEYPPVAQEAYDVLKTPNLPIDYVKSANYQLANNVGRFYNLIEGKKPLRIKFYFVRKDRRKFDYVNIVQIVLDLMIKRDYIGDDNADEVIPVFEGYHVDKNNAGVYIYF